MAAITRWTTNRPSMPVEIGLIELPGENAWCHTYLVRAVENSGTFTWTVPRDSELKETSMALIVSMVRLQLSTVVSS